MTTSWYEEPDLHNSLHGDILWKWKEMEQKRGKRTFTTEVLFSVNAAFLHGWAAIQERPDELWPGLPNRSLINRQWLYESVQAALKALEEWEPSNETEPQGWFRDPGTGRRRPGGDAAQEYVRH